eukprot:3929450-Lingulodinium_polyedra.AAC.1
MERVYRPRWSGVDARRYGVNVRRNGPVSRRSRRNVRRRWFAIGAGAGLSRGAAGLALATE